MPLSYTVNDALAMVSEKKMLQKNINEKMLNQMEER